MHQTQFCFIPNKSQQFSETVLVEKLLKNTVEDHQKTKHEETKRNTKANTNIEGKTDTPLSAYHWHSSGITRT